MSMLSLFFKKKPDTASIARERLQIVLAHERAGRDAADFLPMMQRELLMVVAKYFEVSDEMIKINLESQGETSVLEINVELDKARVKTPVDVKDGPVKPPVKPN